MVTGLQPSVLVYKIQYDFLTNDPRFLSTTFQIFARLKSWCSIHIWIKVTFNNGRNKRLTLGQFRYLMRSVCFFVFIVQVGFEMFFMLFI